MSIHGTALTIVLTIPALSDHANVLVPAVVVAA
jgi:hypothetical protein